MASGQVANLTLRVGIDPIGVADRAVAAASGRVQCSDLTALLCETKGYGAAAAVD